MPRDHQKRTELVAVSITLASWRTHPGDLSEFAAGEIRKELIEALDCTQHVKWAVFGLDISMNDDTNKGFDVAWQLQLYGIAHVEDRLTFSKSLRRSFGHESKRVSRPVVVKSCDGTARAFSYVFKPESVRRIAYWGEGKTRTGAPRKCWRTRKVSLKAREDVELRLYLDQIGLTKRVSLYGLKVVRTKTGVQLNLKKLE